MLAVRGLCNKNGTPDVGDCQKISHTQPIKVSQSHPREKYEEITSENYSRIRSFVCFKGKGECV